MDKILAQEIAQLSNDLATKSIFSLGGDLPAVGDALRRVLVVLQGFDARIAALEKARTPAPAPTSVPAPSSPPPPGAKA